MSKKNIKSNVKPVETNEVETIDVVFVRVVKNFNDATDNNNFVAAGKNNFYRTNKERADMLEKAGYVEYEVAPVVATLKSEDDNANDDEEIKPTDKQEDDNANDDTEDKSTDNQEDNNVNGDDEDKSTDKSEDDITDDDSNPNE